MLGQLYKQNNLTEQSAFLKACRDGDINKVIALWENRSNIDLNLANLNGETPLYFACYKGHTEIVAFLLRNEHLKITNEHNLLYIACQRGHAPVVALLLADPRIIENDKLDVDGLSAFAWCCKEGKKDLVTIFLESGYVNQKLWYTSGFYWACHCKKIEVITLFLKKHLQENPQLLNNTDKLIPAVFAWKLMADLSNNFSSVDRFDLTLESGNMQVIQLSVQIPNLKATSVEISVPLIAAIISLAQLKEDTGNPKKINPKNM